MKYYVLTSILSFIENLLDFLIFVSSVHTLSIPQFRKRMFIIINI